MAKERGAIRLHATYAETGHYEGEDDNFGVQQHNHTDKPHSEPAGGRKALNKEHQRAIPKGRGFHREPDHGPFHDGDE